MGSLSQLFEMSPSNHDTCLSQSLKEMRPPYPTENIWAIMFRGGAIVWPARSPDCSPLDFFPLVAFEDSRLRLLYRQPVQNSEVLRADSGWFRICTKYPWDPGKGMAVIGTTHTSKGRHASWSEEDISNS